MIIGEQFKILEQEQENKTAQRKEKIENKATTANVQRKN